MSATLFALLAKLAFDEKITLFVVFCVLYVCGVLLRNKPYFWKACCAVFAALAILFLFPVFGGLEPNRPGVIATGHWLSPAFILFVMFIVSFGLAVWSHLRRSAAAA